MPSTPRPHLCRLASSVSFAPKITPLQGTIAKGRPTVRAQDGYDHSCYSISTFMDEHLRGH